VLVWKQCSKAGIDYARLRRAAVRARQSRSFVYALITAFVSSIEVRQPRAAVDRSCSSVTRPSQLKVHSTLKSLCRGINNRSDLARHEFARGSGRSAACSNMVSTLRDKATNIVSRGSRAQSIPGLRRIKTARGRGILQGRCRRYFIH
jgi:hypothetical protein